VSDGIPRHRRVLVVEDQAELADTLALLLGVDGHAVDIAADGVAALELVEAREYDAILCDIRMPRLDGPGFHAVLQSVRPHLVNRVVFVTATAATVETQRFLAATGARCLEKPVALDELRAALRDLGLA
jgi:two-component system NtrC family sensor kinase